MQQWRNLIVSIVRTASVWWLITASNTCRFLFFCCIHATGTWTNCLHERGCASGNNEHCHNYKCMTIRRQTLAQSHRAAHTQKKRSALNWSCKRTRADTQVGKRSDAHTIRTYSSSPWFITRWWDFREVIAPPSGRKRAVCNVGTSFPRNSDDVIIYVYIWFMLCG